MHLNFDSLVAYPFTFWIVLAVLAGIIEVGVPSFHFVFVSLAALIAALVALQFGAAIQVISFGLSAVALVFFLRPWMVRRFQDRAPRHQMPSRAESLVGAVGIVTIEIETARQRGRVLAGGEDWAARSERDISVGCEVRIIGHDGILLIVEEI